MGKNSDFLLRYSKFSERAGALNFFVVIPYGLKKKTLLQNFEILKITIKSTVFTIYMHFLMGILSLKDCHKSQRKNLKNL